MSEWNFVIAAYAVAWATLVAYGVRLVLVSRRAAAALEHADGGGA